MLKINNLIQMSYMYLIFKTNIFNNYRKYVGCFSLISYIPGCICIYFTRLILFENTKNFAVHTCIVWWLRPYEDHWIIHSFYKMSKRVNKSSPTIMQNYRFFSGFIIWCASVIEKPDTLNYLNKASPNQCCRVDKSLRG